LANDVEIQRNFYNNVADVAIAFSDEAYRTMFLRDHPIVQILTDENGKIMYDENGKPLTKVLTPEEAKNLETGSDGKVNIVLNGIFNDEEAAVNYAIQHANSDGPIYAIVFPEADNGISELMIAGYQKFMENEHTGLTNSTTQVVNYMTTYGESGLDIDAHSRGSLTVGNAIEYLADNGQNVLDATSINLFGPAYNAEDAANLLNTLSDGTQTSVTLQNHIDDFVGGIIGGNPSTGGETPPNSTTVLEWYNMFINSATAHSCYGNGGGKDQCGDYWGVDWQNPDPKTMIINATNRVDQ
jgi:filamentous hemagglutinin